MKVIVYDRPNANDHAKAGRLTFDEGESLEFDGIPNDGVGRAFVVRRENVRSMKLQITDGAGPHVGLTEIQVFDFAGCNIAPRADVTASSSRYGGDSAYHKDVGSDAWMRQFADPRLIYSRHIHYNLSRPDKSQQLLAPLSRAAGGYGTCGDVFKSTQDADYQTLLAAIKDAKQHLDTITRFNMPGFEPTEAYIYEMKRYGALPETHAAGAPIDVYETDQRYWRSHWWRPVER